MRLPAKLLAAAALLVAAAPPYVPEALAFPYHRDIAGARIWSETPIPPAIDRVVARADALVAASPLATVPSGRRVFLTTGGWRWRWLAVSAEGAFALTRSLSTAIVVNRSDAALDRVTNGTGTRTLSGVLAHERTHLLIRARLGMIAAERLPFWLREGYPEHVARESTLSDAQAAAMHRAGATSVALAYHDARRRVAAALAEGRSVERLLAEPTP